MPTLTPRILATQALATFIALAVISAQAALVHLAELARVAVFRLQRRRSCVSPAAKHGLIDGAKRHCPDPRQVAVFC